MKTVSSQESKKMLGDTLPLLFEIGVEEIPSNVLPNALKQLPQIAEKYFTAARLSFSELEVYGTPRRLILYCPALAASQETKEEIIIGPPKRAAFDAAGNATKAAEGFAKSQNTPLSEIKIENAAALGAAAKGKKGEYLVLRKTKTGENTATLLEKMLPEIIASLSFSRSMRWNETGVAFIRPIRRVLALYGGKVIPFSFAGVVSSDITHGHHILKPEAFKVTDFEHYQSELLRRFVMIDPKERVRLIKSQMEVLEKEKLGVLDLSDESLLEKAAYTVEYPKAICGNFDSNFLAIPKEIIITAMAEHQGYFPLSQDDGELLPHFITILNVDSDDLSLIQKGNERVLRARLHDAQFYFDQDRKRRLSNRLEDLKQVMFQEKLGSVYEKVKRIEKLSAFIADTIECTDEVKRSLERAAGLCKNDLVTGVVREFTSLQGTMGRVYADKEGENSFVARAIEEHYLPRYAGDKFPVVGSEGEILAVADKLDTIVGCFGVGLIPTGSEDPYALRRQGLGIIQILVHNPQTYMFWRRLSLRDAIKNALECYGDTFYVPDISEEILSFFKLRIDSYLQRSRGIRYDLREAVLAGYLEEPLVTVECAEALSDFSKKAIFKSLITVYKRVSKILDERNYKEVDETVFIHASEKVLFKTSQSVDERIRRAWAGDRYADILEILSELHDPLNQFFDDVLVMDKDETIRQNRLSLLSYIRRLFKSLCDFSKIVEVEVAS